VTRDLPERPKILLVAPNVSRMMGGESIKALSILEGYEAMGFEVTQIAHARVRDEMQAYRPDLDIIYIEDTPILRLLYRLPLPWLFMAAESLALYRAAQKCIDARQPWIVHVTSPISPTRPHFRLHGAPVVIGPLNGNLTHPPALLHRESKVKVLQEKLLGLSQRLNRIFFRGKLAATLFVSGGERTVRALEMGGCRREQIVMTLDSGVSSQFRERPRLCHEGVDWRFMFAGRLVPYKACDLVIRALRKVPSARLDVIGDGWTRPQLEALAAAEGVADRVSFLGYIPSGPELFDRFANYRGFAFPSLAEANGIVVQEAMMMGLPIIAVNWGGPAELLDARTAMLIEPESEEAIIDGVARAMALLATQPERAEALSVAARAKAEAAGFDWPTLLRNWVALYDDVLEKLGRGRPFGQWVAAER
jgi:glycosyltransferase involved in cell wall biosynthesis